MKRFATLIAVVALPVCWPAATPSRASARTCKSRRAIENAAKK
jgi:hypothetical protein